MVSYLKYGIQDSKRILADLHDWLGANGFYQTPIYRSATPKQSDQKVRAYQIYITPNDQQSFAYTIRGLLEENDTPMQGGCLRTVRYREQVLKANEATQTDLVTGAGVRLLNISSVHERFLGHFDISK